jgi:hypothetical protein
MSNPQYIRRAQPPNPLLVRRISTMLNHDSQVAPENRPGIPRIHELNRPLQNRRARQRITRRREVERLLAARRSCMSPFCTSTSARVPACPKCPPTWYAKSYASILSRAAIQPGMLLLMARYAKGTQPGESDVDEDEQLLRQRADVDVAAGVVLAVVAQLQRLVASRGACSRP